ncbi:GNAT family N-acetyltransferase [Photobacterium atrarenae]|uniref:GNAT family N-acetyltransferase n=1 Tax=Photobacterium atrarenae TaxID=865757 RepID=A0ABY5GP91_9GAMM|nr:GNAT family N-acetyltransferase [Photobacterium atrarenae]UTV30504.1 GNAT family N-acetyltransferase [Photobacterium atrarenae]
MIREATKDDCIKLAALSIKVWLDTYAKDGIKDEYAKYVLSTFTESNFLELLNTPKFRLLVSEENQALQGYALLNLESYYETQLSGFEVEKLYIDNAFKGRGLGRKLLSEVGSRFGKRYWLYTWVENESNGFYEHLGFNKVGLLSFEFAGAKIDNNVYQSAYT